MAAGDQRAEVRAHARHRGRRQDHPPRHLLRDVRQLQLRRLLQGRRHRAAPGTWSPSRSPTVAGGWRRAGCGPRSCTATTRRCALWTKVTGLPENRIVKLGRKENYWSMGVPGPGGPCSEILYDRGPEYGPEADWESMGTEMAPELEDRYLEIWNLVFMQDELSAVRSKEDFDIVGSLPKRNIDTGMGLERVALPAPGRREHVRDRRDVPGHREGRGAHRQALRRQPRRRRPLPRRRRPHPQLDDAHRRRRHPRQRGPRLRAAPAAAPRGALHAAARLRGPRAARAVPGEPRQDGRDLHRPAPRLGPHLDRRVRRGGRVPPDAAHRHHRSSTPRRPRCARAGARCCPATRRSRCTTPTASRST